MDEGISDDAESNKIETKIIKKSTKSRTNELNAQDINEILLKSLIPQPIQDRSIVVL